MENTVWPDYGSAIDMIAREVLDTMERTTRLDGHWVLDQGGGGTVEDAQIGRRDARDLLAVVRRWVGK